MEGSFFVVISFLQDQNKSTDTTRRSTREIGYCNGMRMGKYAGLSPALVGSLQPNENAVCKITYIRTKHLVQIRNNICYQFVMTDVDIFNDI